MLAHIGEWILVGRRDLPFSILVERYHFANLPPVPYLLPMSSAFPSFLPTTHVGLGLPFLTVLV